MAKKTRAKKTRDVLSPDKYLSIEQIKQLRKHTRDQAAKAKLHHGRRAIVNEAIIDVMINSGLRAAELCQLQMRDMPHCHGKLVIDVREGKGCVRRSVQISSNLAKRIERFVKRYRKGSKPRSFLFVNEHGRQLSYRSLYSRVKIIGDAAGIGRLTPHMLRHSYSMEWYDRTENEFALQDQLGHKDPRTTRIYARTSAKKLRRLVEDFDL